MSHPWLRRPSTWSGSDSGTTAAVGVDDIAAWIEFRVDPDAGAPRDWIVAACAWIYEVPSWRVSIALATVIGERRARAENVDGTTIVYPCGGGWCR